MTSNSEKHQFAFYWQELSEKSLRQNETVTLKNSELFHRFVHILRLKTDETCIFFDAHKNIEVTIKSFDKKNMITFLIDAIKENVQLKPHITFLLPLLKREAFEHAIYSLVELGANEIQLVMTEKTQRKWGGAKELERLQRIMIAAAEQSKNFAMPTIHEPQELARILPELKQSCKKIFFDAQGVVAYNFFKELKKEPVENLIALIGPEGDLTLQEKRNLQQYNVLFCRLTPTVLRAEQAVVVGMGIMRSLI